MLLWCFPCGRKKRIEIPNVKSDNQMEKERYYSEILEGPTEYEVFNLGLPG
jgi:hypothetical protein